MNEGVAIDELDRPVDNADNASQDAEHDGPDDISLRGLLLLRDAACLPYHVNERHDQGPEADAAEAVRHAPPERASRRSPRHAAWLSGAKVPAAVEACDGAVQRVFDPFADPVSGKRDEHE